MDIKPGFAYHIKDEYFELAKQHGIDQYLMDNKDGRPSFLCLEDKNNPELLWFVPISSRLEKFKSVADKKIARHGKCNTIVFGSFGGKEHAFLIQNIFPTTAHYIDHVHTLGGAPVALQTRLQAEIEGNVKDVLRMHSRGIKGLVFTRIDDLKQMVLAERQKEKAIQPSGKPSILAKLESIKGHDNPPVKNTKEFER